MKKGNQTTFSVLTLSLLVAAGYLTVTLISPPAPLAMDAPATEFSAGRALQDLEIITHEPHPIGFSLAHTRVRDYLLNQIRALGLQPQVQDTFGLRVFRPGSILGGSVENVLVRLSGTHPEGAILLMSHYDSTPGGPGAVDSGSGVVTVLEILRALQAGEPLHQDVIFLFTDGEEPGMIGAHAFVDQHPWFEDVRLVVNLDQFLVGPPVLFRTSQGNGFWVKALANSTKSVRPAHISLPFDLFPSGDTDLLPFIQAGVPGAEFNGGGPFTEKHTRLDLPGLVNPGSLQQAGEQLLNLIQHLSSQPSLEAEVSDQTYFPILGILVNYPIHFAWFFTIFAGLSFLGMIVYGFRTRVLTWRGLGMGLIFSLLSIALCVAFTNLIWRGVLAFHPEYAYFSHSGYRQKLSEEHLYLIGFMVLTLVVVVSMINLLRQKVSTFDMTGGSLIPWFALMLATTALVPSTSYLFTWVLISCALALLLALAVRYQKKAWLISGIGYLVSTILGIFLFIPLFYLGTIAGPMSPDTPLMGVLVGLVAMWFISMTPILVWITDQRPWLLPSVATLAALGFLSAGHILVGKYSPPPLVNSIGYWLDANKGDGQWVTFSDEFDNRQMGLLKVPVRRPYTELFPQAPPLSVITSTAPLLNEEGPLLEVLMDEWVVDRRVVRTRITTSLYERVLIFIPEESHLLAVTVPGKQRIESHLDLLQDWQLRFEGLPAEGIEVSFEFSGTGNIHFTLIEEATGLPPFPGLSTQPEPGTMKSPGNIFQLIPTDFTAIYREITLVRSVDQ